MRRRSVATKKRRNVVIANGIDVVSDEQKVKKHRRTEPGSSHSLGTKLSIANFSPIEVCNAVLTCGNADVGQLGQGENAANDERCSEPKLVAKLDPPNDSFIQIAAGSFHTAVLTADHQVYTSGCSDECVLGRTCFSDDGQTERIEDQDYILRPVTTLKAFEDEHGHPVQISAGDSHMAVLTSKGSVFVWGSFRDKQGCLGLNVLKKSLSSQRGDVVAKSSAPFLTSSFKQRIIVKIASGFHHVAMLASDGVIWTVGAGDVGQLGRLAPQFRDSSVSNRVKGKMLVPQPIAVVLKRKKVFFDNIWCAGYCCFARDIVDKSIFVWGLNNYFQLGIVPENREENIIFQPQRSDQFNIEGVSWRDFSGDHHIVALDDKNNVHVIGRGDDSRLGNGKAEEQSFLTRLDLNGKVKGIAAGNSCSFAWQEEGKVLVWGFDLEGETGMGFDDENEIKKPTPLKAESLHDVQINQIAVGGQHAVFLGAKLDNTQKRAKK